MLAILLSLISYQLSSPYVDLKMKAIKSMQQVKTQSTEKTIRRGTYQANGGVYTLKQDIYGSISSDIKGFAQDSEHLAVIKRSLEDNLAGNYFINVEDSSIYTVTKTLEDDEDMSVYEIQPTEFLSLFSYIHVNKSLDASPCTKTGDNVQCDIEKEYNFNWENNAPILTNFGTILQLGAGAYAKFTADVDLELTGVSNFKLKVIPTFTGIAESQFKLNEGTDEFDDVTVWELNQKVYTLYQIPLFSYNFQLNINLTAQIDLKEMALTFKNNFDYKKGLQIKVSKTIVLTSASGLSTSKGFEFSISDTPGSVPNSDLKNPSFWLNLGKEILKSIQFHFKADVKIGARLTIDVESKSKTTNYFYVDLILNPIFDTTLTFDLDNCLAPYIKYDIQPYLNFIVKYPDFELLGFNLIKKKTHQWEIFKFNKQNRCLFNPSNTDEGSTSHYSNPATNLNNYLISPHFWLKQATTGNENKELFVTLFQYEGNEVVNNHQCYFESLQYTQNSITASNPTNHNICGDWLIQGDEDTEIQIDANYEILGPNPSWIIKKKISEFRKYTYYETHETIINAQRDLYVYLKIETIPTIEFDKLFETNGKNVAFQNSLNVPEYTLVKKQDNKYIIDTNAQFTSMVSNSKTQSTVWKNSNNDEYVEFSINKITIKNVCYGDCDTLSFIFTTSDSKHSKKYVSSEEDNEDIKDDNAQYSPSSVFPYPIGRFYSSVKNKAYSLKCSLTDGSDVHAGTLSIYPNELNSKKTQSLTFKDSSDTTMAIVEILFRKINPLIICRSSVAKLSGIIVQTINDAKLNYDITTPTYSNWVTISSRPMYTVLDFNLKTTNPITTQLSSYVVLRFIDYTPVTPHVYYSAGTAAILADSSNIYDCSDGYKHLFLIFRSDKQTSTDDPQIRIFAFTAVPKKDDFSLIQTPLISIQSELAKFHPPFYGGTIPSDQTWNYVSSLKTISSDYDLQLSVFDYARFVFCIYPTSTCAIGWYQRVHVLEENTLETLIDINTFSSLNLIFSSISLKFDIKVEGNGNWEYDGETYTTSQETFTKQINQLSPKLVTRICNSEQTTMCLMTLTTESPVILKYGSTDGIYLYGDNSNSAMGPGVYYDYFEGGTITFWKTWEGTSEQMIHKTFSSSEKGTITPVLAEQGSNIILTLKYSTSSSKKHLIQDEIIPITRKAIINSGSTIELLGLDPNAVLLQNKNGELVFPKEYLPSSATSLQLDSSALSSLVGVDSSNIENTATLDFTQLEKREPEPEEPEDLDESEDDGQDPSSNPSSGNNSGNDSGNNSGNDSGNNSGNNSGYTGSTSENQNENSSPEGEGKKSNTGVIVAVVIVVVVLVAAAIIVVIIFMKKKNQKNDEDQSEDNVKV